MAGPLGSSLTNLKIISSPNLLDLMSPRPTLFFWFIKAFTSHSCSSLDDDQDSFSNRHYPGKRIFNSHLLLRNSLLHLRSSILSPYSSDCSFFAASRGPSRACRGRVSFTTLEGLLEGNTIGHASHGVLALQFLELDRRVLVQELIKREVATSNSDLNLVTHATNHYTLGTKLISAFRFAHEHDLQFLSVRVVVDVLCKLLVDCIVLDRDVDCDARLEIDDILSQCLNFVLAFFHLLKHFKLGGLWLVVFFLELLDVCWSALKLDLQLAFASLHTVMVGFPHVSLLLDVPFLCQSGIQLENCALELNDCLLAFAETKFKLIDLALVVWSLSVHLSGHAFFQSSHIVDVLLLALSHLPLELLDVSLEWVDFLD